MPPDITRVAPEHGGEIAAMLGRAFQHDPIFSWPLRAGVTAEDVGSAFAELVEIHVGLGTLWQTGGCEGAAAWLPPEHAAAYAEVTEGTALGLVDLTDDAGAAYVALWNWIVSCLPGGPSWLLDFVGVEPSRQGRGLGTALVRHGLARAHAEGSPADLLTGTAEHVAYYERLGFRVTLDADAPGGGPHVWFMRALP